MRKILLLSLLLTVLTAYSRQISPEEASAVASEFMQISGLQRQISANPVKIKGTNADKESSPYHVFNSADGKGFVIVAGDDRAPKILGYSDKGSFDGANMPPQLKALLTSYAERLESLPDVRHESWNKAPARSSEKEVLLPTANWGQGYPYNTECPVIEGENALTGCVATAMAIVMKYHNWPEGYDWSDMPMNTEEDPINFEENNDLPALAKIMHDAGEAVFMEYGLEESGAYLDWIGHRLQSVFHYSPECQYLGGDHFEKDEWEAMLRGNLDKGLPVIYDGYGTGGHHAFVLDGYNGSDMYHVNWGWDGLDNGYYALDALDPVEGWGFSDYNGMIMNIEPDHEMSDYSECFTDYGYLWSFGARRRAAVMNVSVEDIKKGEPFHLFNSALTVTPGFKGQIGVAIVDKDNKIKEVLRTVYRTTFETGTQNTKPDCLSVMFYDLIPTCDIEPGDRLQFVSKHDNDDYYKLILGTTEWPSSRPVAGNVPERSVVAFNIGEGVECSVYVEESGQEAQQLPVGVTEIPAYYGTRLTIHYKKEDSESNNPIHVAIHGNMYGGDAEYLTTLNPLAYPLEIFGDRYEVEIKILDLHDEAVHLDEAGSLKEKMADAEGINIGSLKVTGKMNALDFWYIRDNCPSLQLLDLKGVEIEEVIAGDGAWVSDGMTHPANSVPYRALPGLVNLETLIFPEGLTAIDGFSIMAMNLSSISIPAGVTNIGRDAFWGNENLQVVESLNPEPPAFDYTPFEATKCPANGILFVPEGSKERYAQAEVWQDFSRIIEGPMPNPLKTEITADNLIYECFIDEACLIGYVGEPVDVLIPEKITANGSSYAVTSIKEECFNWNSSLRSVTMPESISSIGYNCFYGCRNLESVKLSSNVTQMPYGAFGLCESLKEFPLTNITFLGDGCLYGTGVSSLFIPKTLSADPYSYPFGANINLEAFEVEEGHEYYKAVDGLLYRISEEGLILESVPGAKTGVVSTAPECIELLRNSVSMADYISGLILNEGLQMIHPSAVNSNKELSYLSIPVSVTILENAFYANGSLESVTFNGTPTTFGTIFAYCPELKHIYVNGEERISFDGLFDYEYENLNIYNPSAEKKFEYSGNHTILVPGAYSDIFGATSGAKVLEMWEYKIDRKNNRLAVTPAMEGISIDKVTINGRVVAPEGGIYTIFDEPSEMKSKVVSEADPYARLDVEVEYTLHGRQSMTTHYAPEFNATIPDSVVTGIEDMFGMDSDIIDVYATDGTVLVKNGDKSALNQLAPGVYIIRKGGRCMKVAVK
ncbi:MAG: C10 family peptidase [Muribaculaceae bacterium]|nr:C10 family peptidase [Muribaculaceae bacterium]